LHRDAPLNPCKSRLRFRLAELPAGVSFNVISRAEGK
jgi:hypothetical protein